MGRNVVVSGTQWGDEGQGKGVGWLTPHARGGVRLQGGPYAGPPRGSGGRTGGPPGRKGIGPRWP